VSLLQAAILTWRPPGSSLESDFLVIAIEGLQIVVYPKDIGLIRLHFAGDANSELSLQPGFPE
jgi:hypothetical protein